MKQAKGLVLALAGASAGATPALADGLGAGDIKLRSDGLPVNALANYQDEAAALAEGRSLLAAGNAAQAISVFRIALGQNARSVAALNGIAIAYDRLGRIDLARQHFEMALALEPDAGDIAYNLGWTLHRAGLHRDSIAWLQRASSSDDGRAAAAARRALLLVAAALETAGPAPVLAAQAPMRVASARIEAAQAALPTGARIDMASSGEAVLVLPGTAAKSLATPRLAVAQRAGGVPVVRIAAELAPAKPGALPVLAAPVTIAAEDTDNAPALVAAQLGELATLTIPLATLAPAPAQPAVLAQALVPQVISIADVPPDLGAWVVEPGALVSLAAVPPAPLRLLDLAALPELATATPMAPHRFIAPAALAIDWLAGFDASRFAMESDDRAHRRLVAGLGAQADWSAIDDKDAVRLAIARLEALVARIGVMRA